jgi:hypothetical protein
VGWQDSTGFNVYGEGVRWTLTVNDRSMTITVTLKMDVIAANLVTLRPRRVRVPSVVGPITVSSMTLIKMIACVKSQRMWCLMVDANALLMDR